MYLYFLIILNIILICKNELIPWDSYMATKVVDVWHPFGTTTPRPPGLEPRKDETLVRLPIGNIMGKQVNLTNLPWTADHDPAEIINEQLGERDPNPIPSKNNVTVHYFLGIPYALPPIGKRRFQLPLPVEKLEVENEETPYLAFNYKPTCSQDVETRPTVSVNQPYPYLVDEDCLYLNIFTPSASRSSTVKYPVIVFFHGGNFQTGSGNEWPGYVLASRGLVVVTINYRLNAFGFMALGDKKTGNYGIKDQRLALQWVQQNIGLFGGDKEYVTIVGHDAGAVSGGLHMLSPLSIGLFKSVVAMSGAEVSYHSTIGKPVLAYNNTIKLGRYLGCTQAIAENVWNCIKESNADDIVSALSPTKNPKIPVEYNRYMFLPNIGEKEFPRHPLAVLNDVPLGRDNIPSLVPYLTGLNKEDGAEVILEDRTLGEFTDFLQVTHEYQRSFVIEYAYRHNYTMNREAIAEAIDNYYTFWPDRADVWNIRDKFIQLATDAYYTSPIVLSASSHSMTGSKTFMYVNNYNFSKARDGIYKNLTEPSPFPSWMGSCHDCDLYLLFGFPFMPKELLPPYFRHVDWYDIDRNASQLFGSFIRRFVQKGDPNLPSTFKWNEYKPKENYYMDFNYTTNASLDDIGTLKKDYRYQEVAFWNNFIPSLVNYMTTTFPPWEVRERREAVAFKITTGVLALVLAVIFVIAVYFIYKYANSNKEFQMEMLSPKIESRADSRRELVRLHEYPSTTNIDRHTPVKLSSL